MYWCDFVWRFFLLFFPLVFVFAFTFLLISFCSLAIFFFWKQKKNSHTATVFDPNLLCCKFNDLKINIETKSKIKPITTKKLHQETLFHACTWHPIQCGHFHELAKKKTTKHRLTLTAGWYGKHRWHPVKTSTIFETPLGLIRFS